MNIDKASKSTMSLNTFMSLLIWNERHFSEACDEFEYRVILVLKKNKYQLASRLLDDPHSLTHFCGGV